MAEFIEKIRTTDGDKRIDYNALANKPDDPFANLKCGILGDSVTEGTGASTPSKAYANLLAQKFASLENKGIGGSCIAQMWSQPMVSRYNSLSTDLDVIILFGGINDYYANVPIGTKNSTVLSEFNGALNTILGGWSTKYAGKKIYCIAPYQIKSDANSIGKTMQDYVDAVKERCAYYSIPCLDLLNCGGMGNSIDATQKSVWLAADGIHPSDAGHKQIYERVYAFLNSPTSTYSAGGNGDSGIAEWGNIGGNIDDQTDLANALAAKQDKIAIVEPADDDVAKFYLWGNTLPTSKNDGAKDFRYRYISKTKDSSGYCTVKVQGDWSTTYPKKNFNINLFKDAEHTDKDKKNFRGWGKTNKFTLKANYIDHTHARNIVNAWLWKEIVESRSNFASLPEELKTSPHMGCVDGFPVKVYQNGNYYGIFTMNIRKGEFMFGMDDENPLHFAVKGDNNDNGRVENKAYNFRALWDGYDTSSNWQVEAGELDEATGKAGDNIKDALNALITCVKDTDNATFKATIGTYLDMQSAIDYMLFIWAFCGIDSAENNFMLLNYDGVKWITNGYDMDAAWGIYGDGSTTKVSTTTAFPSQYMGNRSLLWERILENYVPEIKARWAELRESILSYPNITNKFERMWYWIGEDLLAEDITVWTNVPSKTVNNIAFTRNYVRDRLAYVDGAIEALVPPVEPIPCTALSLDKNSISIEGVNTETITATPTPTDTTDVVTWTSSNTSVATVNNGVVTSVANGTATITATCGTQTATCSVTVTGISHAIPCTGISLSASELAFTTEDAQTLVATPTPSDTTDVVVWSTSDETKATVNNGVVTPHANGSCTITATCGSYHADCAVTISAFEKAYPLDGATIHAGYKLNSDGTLDGNGTNTYYAATDLVKLEPGLYEYKTDYNTRFEVCTAYTFNNAVIYDSTGSKVIDNGKASHIWINDENANQFKFQLEGTNAFAGGAVPEKCVAATLKKVDNSATALAGQTIHLADLAWTPTPAERTAVQTPIADCIAGYTDFATDIKTVNLPMIRKDDAQYPTSKVCESGEHRFEITNYNGVIYLVYIGVGRDVATAVQYFTDNNVVLEINGGAS